MKKKIFYNNEETNYSVDEEGNVYNDKTGRILKGTYARNEYHSVQLTIDGKAKSLMTHRLVAEAAKAIGSSSSTVKRAADAERIGKGYYWILDSQNISISDLINK